MQAERPYHIIIWGATGFTGKLVAEYLTVNGPANLKFALGGRSEKKLNEVAKSIKLIDTAGRFKDSEIPIVIADSHDQESLDKMVGLTKVVITTVGPYAKYGIPLVDACVRIGTHYVDLTGEPPFVKETMEKFHDKAVANKVKIVHGTGFDSIPSDLGTLLITNHFKAQGLKTNNVRFSVIDVFGGVSGGTIASMANIMDSLPLSELKEMLNPDYLVPVADQSLSKKIWGPTTLYYDNGIKKWQTPFVMEMANSKIVRRSNYLLGYGANFQYCEGMASGNILFALVLTIFWGIAGLLMLLPPARSLLTWVMPAGSGPNEYMRKNGHATIELHGEATNENGETKHAKAIVKCVQDPGYGETSKMISESALCLALDSELIQSQDSGFKVLEGGILTPASAMGTVLIERLKRAGMTFEVSDA